LTCGDTDVILAPHRARTNPDRAEEILVKVGDEAVSLREAVKKF